MLHLTTFHALPFFFALLNKMHSKTSSAPGGKHTWRQKTVHAPFLTETRKNKKLKAGTISVYPLRWQ
jgi:hypothetical protein